MTEACPCSSLSLSAFPLSLPLISRCVCTVDFGFAQYMSPWDEQSSLRGSPLYMAPEIVCRRQYDARVDLWSVGVILYGERALGVFFFFIYFFIWIAKLRQTFL